MSLGRLLQIDRPLIVLDLETTSELSNQARIVEIGLKIYKPDAEPTVWSHLVNPGCPIPPESTEVHHITDEMVANEPPFEYFADNLIGGFIGVDFAGTYVRFDLQVLQKNFERCGRKWDYEAARIVDSYRLWQVGEPRSLEDAVKRWPNADVEGLGYHRAGRDCRVSDAVIFEQLTEWSHLPRTVRELDMLLSPDRFDAEGKLRWRGDRLIVNFGKQRGDDLADLDRGYIRRFILRSDFSEKVKEACRLVLNGGYPVRLMEEGPVDSEPSSAP